MRQNSSGKLLAGNGDLSVRPKNERGNSNRLSGLLQIRHGKSAGIADGRMTKAPSVMASNFIASERRDYYSQCYQ